MTCIISGFPRQHSPMRVRSCNSIQHEHKSQKQSVKYCSFSELKCLYPSDAAYCNHVAMDFKC